MDSIWSLFSFIFSTILKIKRFKALFDRSQKCWDGIWNWRSDNPSPQCVQITSCVCTVYWSNDQWLDNGNIGEVNPIYATLYVHQQVTDFLLTFSCDDLRHCFHLVLEHCIFCSFYFFFFFLLVSPSGQPKQKQSCSFASWPQSSVVTSPFSWPSGCLHLPWLWSWEISAATLQAVITCTAMFMRLERAHGHTLETWPQL